MLSQKVFCIFLCFIGISLTENLKFDYLEKCSIKDSECQINMLQTLMHKYKKIGMPELGIPPMDPYEIKNITVSVLGMVDMTMVDGMVEGTTNCIFKKFETDIEKKIVTAESICERIIIGGHYIIQAGPFVKPLAGNTVSGNGNGSIRIDNMTLKIKYPFYVKKDPISEEIFLVPKISGAEYSTEDIEMIEFKANNVLLGNQEVSEQLMRFMNDNRRMLLRSFGRYFSDKVMDVFNEYLQRFFLAVSANKFFTDDFSLYVDKQI